MPPILKFVLAVSLFVIPLLVVIWLLIRWQNQKVKKQLTRVASNLGLDSGSRIANRLFEFPAALGVVDGHAIFVGTAVGRRRGAPRRYVLLQVVVSREPNGDPSRVGPQHLDQPSQGLPYAELERSLQGRVDARGLSAARSSMLQGGQELQLTQELIIRTFATPGITSAGWARLVEASARVMVEYARAQSSGAQAVGVVS